MLKENLWDETSAYSESLILSTHYLIPADFSTLESNDIGEYSQIPLTIWDLQRLQDLWLFNKDY